ncbi:MAG: LytTR family transcriptional regulator DNA-binding domain-containing protein [Eggerthellaceae bacterium]|nr:LytTR family transcriptional regulator DNA-binding domain-containing protein [Eggerthellaceae bacterium]
MKLLVEQVQGLDDINVIVRFTERNSALGRLLSVIRGLGEKIQAHDKDRTVMLDVIGIYYFESVDKQTFAYCSQEVYQVHDRLYQVKERLERFGFVQVSKSCLLNVNMLESVRNVANSKMEAELSNGEKISISRKYIPELKAEIRRRAEA